jgi:release factor glutamine methyltransferase
MGEVIKVDQRHPDPATIERAERVLEGGGVVVVPTDSVYGISCAALPGNPGHERIFRIKRRDRAQTLPLFVAEASDLDTLATVVAPWAAILADAFWPGALTLVVRSSNAIPTEYQADDGTVALRCPDSALVRELVRRVGPLAQTSANLHGRPAARSADELDPAVVADADLVLDAGVTPKGAPSTIVNCVDGGPRVLREGAIPATAIAALLA